MKKFILIALLFPILGTAQSYLAKSVNGNNADVNGNVTISTGSGTVTSIATGVGLSGGTITGSGTIVADTSGTLVTKTFLTSSLSGISGGSGTVTSVSGTTPINVATGTTTPAITIDNAAADGSTKGASTYTAADFNASSGVISIDYTNGQSASGSTKGFLTSADWNTFNEKTKTYAGQGLIYRNDSLLITGRLTEPMSILSVGSPVNNPIGGVATVWSDIPTRPTITNACYSDDFSHTTGTEVINFSTINTQIVQTGIFDQNSSLDLDDTKLMFVNDNGVRSTYLTGLPTNNTANQIVLRDSTTNELFVTKVDDFIGYRGTATLSSGTVTVSTARVKTGMKIYLSVNTPSGTQGFLSASTADIVDGTSFVINSTNAGDSSTVNWWIAP